MEQAVKTIEIDLNSPLGRWYRFNRSAYDLKYNEHDICKFRRVCFITAPLKWLVLTVIAVFVIGLIVMNLKEFVIVGAAIIGLFVVASILFFGTRWVAGKTIASPATKASWKSFREKWCAKVTFIEN